MTQIAKPSKSHDDDFDNSAKNYMLILSFICCSRLCKNSYTVNGMCRNLTQATRYIYPLSCIKKILKKQDKIKA